MDKDSDEAIRRSVVSTLEGAGFASGPWHIQCGHGGKLEEPAMHLPRGNRFGLQWNKRLLAANEGFNGSTGRLWGSGWPSPSLGVDSYSSGRRTGSSAGSLAQPRSQPDRASAARNRQTGEEGVPQGDSFAEAGSTLSQVGSHQSLAWHLVTTSTLEMGSIR